MMPNHETSMALPPRWGDDTLSSFLYKSFKNTLATFVRKRRGFDMLSRVDHSFLRIAENLINLPGFLTATFLLRSHSAFRAACRLATSGQVPESFPVLRACLEYALYALHVESNELLGETWLRRHDDDLTKRQVKQNFQSATVMETLRTRDAALHAKIKQLYERAIDFGGHPNEFAIAGSMILEKQSDRVVRMQQIYLHADSLSLDHVIKTSAQIGLGSLCIFQHIFRERFEILGVRAAIDQLRRQL
jgi:hypothetical protein